MDTLGEKGGYRSIPARGLGPGIWLDAITRDKGFGNGRTARNLFEHAVSTQAMRLGPIETPTDDQLTTLMADDIPPPGEGPLTVVRTATGNV